MQTEWKPTKPEAPDFKCRKCESDDVWYRVVGSYDEAHTDTNYQCRGCGRDWWVDGIDS